MKRVLNSFYVYLATGFLVLPGLAVAASSQAELDGFKSLVAFAMSVGIGYWIFSGLIKDRQHRHREQIAPEKFHTFGDFMLLAVPMLFLSILPGGALAVTLHFLSGSSIGLIAWPVCTAGAFVVALYLKCT